MFTTSTFQVRRRTGEIQCESTPILAQAYRVHACGVLLVTHIGSAVDAHPQLVCPKFCLSVCLSPCELFVTLHQSLLKQLILCQGSKPTHRFSKTAACGRAFSPESEFSMRVVSGHVRDASPTCTWPGIGPDGSVLRSTLRCVTSTPGYRRISPTRRARCHISGENNFI